MPKWFFICDHKPWLVRACLHIMQYFLNHIADCCFNFARRVRYTGILIHNFEHLLMAFLTIISKWSLCSHHHLTGWCMIFLKLFLWNLVTIEMVCLYLWYIPRHILFLFWFRVFSIWSTISVKISIFSIVALVTLRQRPISPGLDKRCVCWEGSFSSV